MFLKNYASGKIMKMKESKIVQIEKCPTLKIFIAFNRLKYMNIKKGGTNFDDPLLPLLGHRKLSHCPY